jgi:hypothetical protein
VLVASLAAFLWIVATYVLTKVLSDPAGGWFAYAPNTGGVFAEGDRVTTAEYWAVWLGALVVWTVVSLWLLRPSGESGHGVDPD